MRTMQTTAMTDGPPWVAEPTADPLGAVSAVRCSHRAASAGRRWIALAYGSEKCGSRTSSGCRRLGGLVPGPGCSPAGSRGSPAQGSGSSNPDDLAPDAVDRAGGSARDSRRGGLWRRALVDLTGGNLLEPERDGVLWATFPAIPGGLVGSGCVGGVPHERITRLANAHLAEEPADASRTRRSRGRPGLIVAARSRRRDRGAEVEEERLGSASGRRYGRSPWPSAWPSRDVVGVVHSSRRSGSRRRRATRADAGPVPAGGSTHSCGGSERAAIRVTHDREAGPAAISTRRRAAGATCSSRRPRSPTPTRRRSPRRPRTASRRTRAIHRGS
jgi:hypothetical protein